MSPNDGRVVSNFIVQALQGNPITIYGTGLQTRSFCYVDDLIKGLIALFFVRDIEGPVNLGNPSPITMKALADEIIQITGSTSKIEYLPLPQDDPIQREPDITKATTHLGWKPSVERGIGLEKTIEYFKQMFKNNEY